MKCTLRKVRQGIVATIDERPKEGEWYYAKELEMIFTMPHKLSFSNPDAEKIIASTFGVGMELVFGKYYSVNENELIDFTKLYEYTESETQIIIKL